jgi:hypothetical protein
MNIKTAHYSKFQTKKSPSCADPKGFLHFRDGFEKLPAIERTEPEHWIAKMMGNYARWLAVNFI